MRENRRVRRVGLLGNGWLHHNEAEYSCRLVNISSTGALVNLKKVPSDPLHPGDKCSLTLYQPDSEQHYQKVEAQIIRFESDEVALEFTELEKESQNVFSNLIQKEMHFLDGGQKLINLGRELAELIGIELTMVNFDNGELNKEREMHTLRLSTGEHAVNVHLHRDEIESFNVQHDSEQTKKKIYHAIERLSEM
jgi:hypothetical protein